MNKKILAVAVAAAMAAPLAVLADEGNVTLYGSANMAVEWVDNGVDDGVTNVSTNQSVLGVKGFEPLGNGLKAVFLFDSLLNLDSGGPTLFDGGRDGWAGLSGGFGTVALGFQGRPWKTSTNNLDVFGSTIADYSSIMGTIPVVVGGEVVAGAFFDSGCGNALIYFAPNMNGLSGHAQYCNDEVEGAKSDQYGAQVNYGNGPLYLAFSHDRIQTDGVDDLTASKVAASYTFAAATTLTGIYERIDIEDVQRDSFYIAAAHKMGNNTLKAAYAHASDTDLGFDDGADYFAVGADHNFSKRTSVYALYARTSNDDDGVYGLGSPANPLLSSTGSTFAGGFGEDVSAFAVGMKHNF
ncbi:MAG: porin [Gammaproteobacteria bacterium]